MAFTLALLLTANARAQYTQTVLYSFCPAGGNCTDGSEPYAGLIADPQGNLYGTASEGGANNGTVFELSPPAGGVGPWIETVLYTFCTQPNCIDGSQSFWGLTIDSKGNLYGTTAYGGTGYQGTVFELSPPVAGSGPWTYSVLYPFTGGQDGGQPLGGVIFDAAQTNLYGTASAGGVSQNGTVFRLSPPTGGSGPWTETTLYGFQADNDGKQPAAGLTFDLQGNLYGGTTNGTGNSEDGIVFELSPPSGGSGPWTETILLGNNQVGGNPDNFNSNLIFDPQGNLYSASGFGGSLCCGAVFELTPSGLGGAWNETTIYSFGYFTPMGSYPAAGPLLDTQGNLYGTTAQGGNLSACIFASLELGCGVVYVASPAGPGAWTENLLYVFSSTDGANPIGSLIEDSHGNLYGTTSRGGAYGNGVVFELSPMATSTSILSSQNPSTYGQGVYFTATVMPSGAAGSVQFQIDGDNFGQPAPLSGGQAVSGVISTLSASTHSISAIYPGTVYYGSSTSSLMQTVIGTKVTPTVTLTSVFPNKEPYGASLGAAISATLSWSGSDPAPTSARGPLLSFSSNAPGRFAPVLCSGTTSPIACGTLFLPVVNGPAGIYTIIASYAGDSNYYAASSPQTNNFSITADMPFATVTPNPVTVRSGSTTPVTVTATFTGVGPRDAAPDGTVSFSAVTGTLSDQSCKTSQDSLICTVSYEPTGKLAPGTYNNYITASITAAGDYKAASDSTSLKITK